MSSLPTPSEEQALRVVTGTRRFATARVIMALVMREMATSYGRSPGGYIWAILEPVAGVALLVAIFSLGFKNPPLGTNFAIFYATGLVPFLMYMSVSNKVAAALTFSRQLLIYPSVTFFDALIARFLLEFITQLLVSYLIVTAVLLIYDTQTFLYLPGIALSYAMLAVLAFGVGTMNAFLQTRFPIWARIWAVMNRPLLIVSGIIFIPENVPEPYRTYMLYNPIVHFIAQMRRSFYPYYEAAYTSVIYVFAVGLILTVFGLIFLLRYHRDLLNP